MNGGLHAVPVVFDWTRPSSVFRRLGCRLAYVYRRFSTVIATLFLIMALASCSNPRGDPPPKFTFRLLTGSENRSLVPMIESFAGQKNVAIEFTHKGSVDTMLEVQAGAEAYDAVWPASSIWIALGNTGNVVSQTRSIMTTPVVFAVKRAVAERLGWIGRDLSVEDILAAAESGQLRYMTTSATQSNSGAMAYLGYLYAFAGHPDVLTIPMLHDPAVAEKTRRILSLVDRTAGASGFLRDLFLQQYDAFDGMVNNESAVITANQQLVQDGRDPLYVIYPVDGLAIADWPLGFVDHGDAAKAEFFSEFQEYLLSEDVQKQLLADGRRVGIGMNPVGANPAVFNPDWGIDVNRVIDPITLPPPDVIEEALRLYQTALRKPSFTVFCLDFSGSMEGEGATDLKTAMRVLLEPEQAAHYLLQPSSGDVTIVLPFNSGVINQWRADGNDPTVLRDLLANVTAQHPDGGTNIYDCVASGLEAMKDIDTESFAPAIILMTDGRSNAGSFTDVRHRLDQGPPGIVPVYPILFGDASEDQLKQIAESTSGRVFDGQTDLVGAMREAKGYN